METLRRLPRADKHQEKAAGQKNAGGGLAGMAARKPVDQGAAMAAAKAAREAAKAKKAAEK